MNPVYYAWTPRPPARARAGCEKSSPSRKCAHFRPPEFRTGNVKNGTVRGRVLPIDRIDCAPSRPGNPLFLNSYRWVPLGSDSLGHTFGQLGTHLWNHLCFGVDLLRVQTSKMCKIDAKTTPETIWKSIPKTFWNLDLWTTVKIIKTQCKNIKKSMSIFENIYRQIGTCANAENVKTICFTV